MCTEPLLIFNKTACINTLRRSAVCRCGRWRCRGHRRPVRSGRCWWPSSAVGRLILRAKQPRQHLQVAVPCRSDGTYVSSHEVLQICLFAAKEGWNRAALSRRSVASACCRSFGASTSRVPGRVRAGRRTASPTRLLDEIFARLVDADLCRVMRSPSWRYGRLDATSR